MAEGRLKCCGSSFFLKKHFGAGYHLICVKEDECNSDEVTELLKKYLPNISISTDVGAELSYHLPDDDTSFFEQMFNDLESNLQSLHLSSFGVSLTTLEDVFHRMNTDNIGNGHMGNGATITTVPSESNNENIGLLRGLALVRSQWYALFKKKWYYWKRNWLIYVLLNVLAVAMFVYGAHLINSPPEEKPIESLPISLDSYVKSVTISDESNANDVDGFTSK